jgi:hypothetical protein
MVVWLLSFAGGVTSMVLHLLRRKSVGDEPAPVEGAVSLMALLAAPAFALGYGILPGLPGPLGVAGAVVVGAFPWIAFVLLARHWAKHRRAFRALDRTWAALAAFALIVGGTVSCAVYLTVGVVGFV